MIVVFAESHLILILALKFQRNRHLEPSGKWRHCIKPAPKGDCLAETPASMGDSSGRMSTSEREILDTTLASKGDPQDSISRRNISVSITERSLSWRRWHHAFRLIVTFTSWQTVESNPNARLIVEYSFALSEYKGDLASVDSLLFTISTHDFRTRPNRGPPDKHQHDNNMPASEGDSVDAMSASEGDRTVEEYTKQEKTTRSSFINENARALRTEIREHTLVESSLFFESESVFRIQKRFCRSIDRRGSKPSLNHVVLQERQGAK